MRKLLIALSLAFIGNAYAVDFKSTCEQVNAKNSGTTGRVCRYVGKNYNYSIHQEGKDDIFALMYIDNQNLTDEVLGKMKLLAKVMEVEILDDFYQSIQRSQHGDRIGLQYNDKVVYWRHGSTKNNDYSGFAIIPGKGTAPDGTLRCRATKCTRHDLKKWYGPTNDPLTKGIKNASEEALQGDTEN